jgi:hypothetical protein
MTDKNNLSTDKNKAIADVAKLQRVCYNKNTNIKS